MMKQMPSNENNFHSPRKKHRRKKSLMLSGGDIESRIVELLELANETIKHDVEMAQKYALQARKLQMRTRTKFPSEWKKRFCKHCKTFLYPGINSRTRLSSTNRVISIKCFNCKNYTRIPYYQKLEDTNEGEHQ
ncbi:MAG: ribonuclease P protein component 4 [Candidatus Thorarchaeota archaeon]